LPQALIIAAKEGNRILLREHMLALCDPQAVDEEVSNLKLLYRHFMIGKECYLVCNKWGKC